MPTVTWNLGAGESLANFLTQNPPTGGGSSYVFNGSGGRLLGFYNPQGGSIGNPVTSGSTAPAFLFQSGSSVLVSAAATVSTYAFYHDHLLPNGIQDAIDYLFGTLGSGGNAYQGTTGTQVFEAFRDGDGFIGRGGDDVFQFGRVAGVTDISYVHGDKSDGTSEGGFDTIRFVGAFNGTIHQISNIDAIVFDAAAAVTFALDDTAPSHNPLGNVAFATNVAGASLTLTQAGDGATHWYSGGWTFTGNQLFDLTINTHSGAYADLVAIGPATQGAHFGTVHINTFDGNDTIEGTGTHVVIDGGDGIDILSADGGTAGDGIAFDLLNSPDWSPFGYLSVTGIEQVSMYGGGFDDTLSGGDYDDLIIGQAGDDSINGRGGSDSLSTQAGNDTIRGGGGQDYIDGGLDNDTLYGDDGNDQINGSRGNDSIEGGNDDDFVGGGSGTDTMDGGAGTDTLSFGNDETYIVGSHGVIVSLGSGGIDTGGAIYPADLDADALAVLLAIAGTASFTLAAGTALGADGSIDHFSNFEGLAGSQLGDVLIANDGANALFADTGDDWVYGEAGADTVYAGSGADHVFGGADGDTLGGDNEDDTIMGGAGDDSIDGGDGTGDTAAYAGAWTHFSFSGTGTITVDGTEAGEGTDTVSNIEFFSFNGKTAAADHLANEGPVGVNDSASVTEPSGVSPVTPPATGNALSNDTDPNSGLGDTKALTGARAGLESAGGSLTPVSAPTVVQGTYGALTVDTDGSYSYALDSTRAATIALKGGQTVHDVFTYRIEDFHGSGDLAQIDITVHETDDAPVITSSGGGATGALSINENLKPVTSVHATDIDGPAVTYSILSGADGALFAINSATGALSLRTAPDFEAPADAGHNNVYNVTVRASDGSLFDTQVLTITVKNVVGNTLTGTASANTIDATHGIGGKFATVEADKIDGRDGKDFINGGGGNDTIIGGAGNDRLAGSTGNDHFVFSTALAPAGIDTMTDFTHGQDKIDLKGSIYAGLVSGGIQDAEIKIVTSGHSASSGDHLIYNKVDGTLWYDANGAAGGEVEIAILGNKPGLLNHLDFALI